MARVKAFNPVLISAHAYEREGVNAIPAALSALLSERLGVRFETGIVQANVVWHTGADGYGRLCAAGPPSKARWHRAAST